MIETPVAFIIFNRPDTTRRVFESIRRAEPKKLYIIADGPRNAEELARCEETRSIALDVSWACAVKTKFSSVNLGCRRSVAEGLDWVFADCQEAIILEDDCLPEASFFTYCEQLLTHYRDTRDVMHIAGMGGMPGRRSSLSNASYWFSRYNFIWGWATWRRAWRNYDRDLAAWPARRESGWLESILGDRNAAEYWKIVFDRVHRGEIDTWDYAWTFTCWIQNGLAIVPESNLVSNIGFGPSATHTLDSNSKLANLRTKPLPSPLSHPSPVASNIKRDIKVFDSVFAPPRLSLGRRSLSGIRTALARAGLRRSRLREVLAKVGLHGGGA